MQMVITVPFTRNATANDQAFKTAQEILTNASGTQPDIAADGYATFVSANVPDDKAASVRDDVATSNTMAHTSLILAI